MYTSVQRYLHWLVVALVLIQFATQEPMHAAMVLIDQGTQLSFSGFLVTTLHTLVGASILLLVCYRLVLRRRRPVKPGGSSSGPWLRACALGLHRILYGLLLWMAFSGAAHYYLGWQVAARWHWLGKWVLVSALLVHVTAALWHHFVRKDAVLRQMLRKAPPPDTIGD